MSIEERLAVLTQSNQWDVGEPSKIQRSIIERLESVLKASTSELRKRVRESKKTGSNVNPPLSPSCKNTHQSRMTMRGAELLHAMRGCSQLGVAILLLKYTQDRSSSSVALNLLENEALKLHIREKWTSYKGRDVIRSMCRLALFELDEPKCTACGGGGYGPKGGKCQTCDGGGALKILDTDRALALAIDPESFRKTYKTRLNAVIDLARDHADRAKFKINRNLYG